MEEIFMPERLSIKQIEELQDFDTPTVWNALEGFGVRLNTAGFCYPGLVLRTQQKKPMVGYAVTAKISGWDAPTSEQKNMLFDYFSDIRECAEPSVAVMQDTDDVPIGSFWGEVQATTCKALGAVGTITAGGVRDLNEVGELGFHFFSTHVMVARAHSHIAETKCPVVICGLTINPGDLIHADRHGAVIIPAKAAPTLADACRRVSAAELAVLTPCREAIKVGVRPSVAKLKEWRGQMAKMK